MNTTQAKSLVTTKGRHSNIELLRIFAALFVVIVHYNNAASGKALLYTESFVLNHTIVLFFEMIAICAVNIFVMISGYFLCESNKVSIVKLLKLYIDVIVISVLRYMLYCIMGDTVFNIRDFILSFVPLNWYVAVYSGLYLLSPYLNKIIKNISRKQFCLFLIICFLVLSIWPSGIELISKFGGFSPNSLNPISSQGSGDGYTLVNFILIYFIGAYLKMYKDGKKSIKVAIFATLSFFGLSLVNTLYANIFFGRATSYCNPLVIMQTIAIFTIFQNLSIQSKIINNIAKCSFGVFLLHSFFFPYCNIEYFVTRNPILVPIAILVTSILIYVCSAIIYSIYQFIFSPLFSLLNMKLSFLSYRVE